MKRTFCDKCNKQQERDENGFGKDIFSQQYNKSVTILNKTHLTDNLDLCPKCYQELDKLWYDYTARIREWLGLEWKPYRPFLV